MQRRHAKRHESTKNFIARIGNKSSSPLRYWIDNGNSSLSQLGFSRAMARAAFEAVYALQFVQLELELLPVFHKIRYANQV
jgi:hypothetical protein